MGLSTLDYVNLLTGKPVPGIPEKDFTSQMFNVEMLEQVDRYIVM